MKAHFDFDKIGDSDFFSIAMLILRNDHYFLNFGRFLIYVPYFWIQSDNFGRIYPLEQLIIVIFLMGQL